MHLGVEGAVGQHFVFPWAKNVLGTGEDAMFGAVAFRDFFHPMSPTEIGVDTYSRELRAAELKHD